MNSQLKWIQSGNLQPGKLISSRPPSDVSCSPRAGHLSPLCALALALALALPGTSLAEPVSTGESKSPSGLADRMRNWQNEMSDKFSETFKDLRRSSKDLDQSIAMVSVDLREKKDSYLLRLSIPDRDVEKVAVRMDKDSVSIDVPAEGEAARYQQTLALAGVDSNTTPVIERNQKQNLVTVTIPKTSAGPVAGQPAPASPLENRDRDVLERMARMHREMDQMLKEAFEATDLVPGHRGLFDEPRFGSSVVLQDGGDNYVVRAYLPERELKDLNVTVEGQTLKIEAQAEAGEQNKADGTASSYKAHYLQVLTLPGPVVTEKMKIDRKDEVVVVTLPKAKSSQ